MPIYPNSPKAMVLELINAANAPAIAFAEGNLAFGKPAAVSNDPAATVQVNVRGIMDVVYKGQLPVRYKRLDLGVLFNGTYRPAFSALGQPSLYRLLPELNRTLGTNFTEADLEDVDLTLLDPGDQVTLPLIAKATSLAYEGSTAVLFNRSYVMLSNQITQPLLPLLRHPDPVIDGSRSAGLLTWGQDFTLISAYLKVNRYAAYGRGDWLDLAGLQNALATEYGITAWPGINAASAAPDSVKDYATKDVPNANQNFSRVVIQTDIQSNGYSGTAYFHYNN